MEGFFLEGWHWDRGGDLAGRACFLEEGGFGSHHERQASQHFPFCQDIGGTSIRTRHYGLWHIGCITTHTTATTTTISYVSNTTAVESPTSHSLPTHIRKGGGHGHERDWRRGGRPSTS